MKVQILGVATTSFGEFWELSPRHLAKEAMSHALIDANLEPHDIDALFVGNMLGGSLGGQANIGSFFVEALGEYIPAFHLEAACASGGLALHNAIMSILSGRYETVMVLGIEKMTDSHQEDVMAGLMGAGSEEERQAGATFPGIYALMAQAYMQRYNVSEELLACVPVKNHYHGSINEKAQFQKQVTITEVMKSAKIADPIKLLECSPISDGAAAVIITRKKTNKNRYQVTITASEVATDCLSLCKRETLTALSAVVHASTNAYKSTGITPSNIQVAELHDCFSIAEILATEDLGLSHRGKGAYDIAEGTYTLGQGTLITNPSGGLKSCGHPVGATGIKQVVEITTQLRGEAGKRQVENAKIGLTHNVGGSGTIAVIHILQNNI